MPEEPAPKNPASAWKSQPEEKRPVSLDRLVRRRTRELYSSTRIEILLSLGAAVFFVAVMAWRFASTRQQIPWLAWIAVLVWVVISLYRFRHRLGGEERADSRAAPGLEYYRRELERRRDHLRSAWIWHGPLLLACLTLLALWAGKIFVRFQPWIRIAPLLILLAAWIAFGFVRRRQQADELQREIDEIGRPDS